MRINIMKTITVLSACLLLLGATAFPAGVPDFSLKNVDGTTFRIGDHLGQRVIVMDFWATWCGPCKKLLKKLQEIKNSRSDVLVVAISVDDATTMAAVNPYIQGKGFDFTVLLDPDSQVVRLFNPESKIPYTVIIDKKGSVSWVHAGYNPGDEAEIAKRVDELIR